MAFAFVWIAAIFLAVLPGSNVWTAGMNICWHFLVSGANSARLAIRKEWLNMANGC